MMLWLGLLIPANAIKIQLNYTYDTNNFFSSPDRKDALQAVANFYEKLLTDELLEINNSTFGGSPSWTARMANPSAASGFIDIPNLVVPANTLIVYVGSWDMPASSGVGGAGVSNYPAGQSAAWINRITSRGQSGALTSPATDFGPWGGSLAFDTTPIRPWRFSTTSSANNTLPFISIALHEMGHLLGFGTSASWSAKITSGTFRGINAVQSYGANVPLYGDNAHWRDDAKCLATGYDPTNSNNVLSEAYGSFGTPHGISQIALMDPSLCSVGSVHKVMTDLDISALRDIGWQVDVPVALASSTFDSASYTYNFTWPSTTGFTYRIERNYTLSGLWTILNTQNGNGNILTFTTPSTSGQPRAFYRLNAQPMSTIVAAQKTKALVLPSSSNANPVVIDTCYYSEVLNEE